MINRLFRAFKSDIEKRICKVEDRLRNHLKPEGYSKLWIHHISATDIDPKHLAIFICVGTDKEQTELESSDISQSTHTWLKEEGYPLEAIKHVGVRVDSYETVKRDYKGDWRLYYQ